MEDSLTYITDTYLAGASCVGAGKSFKMVRLSGNYARICGTANGAVHGLLLNEPTNTGDPVRILFFGKTLVRSSSGLIAGDTFVSDNTGRAVTAVFSAASNTAAFFGGRITRADQPKVNTLTQAMFIPWTGYL